MEIEICKYIPVSPADFKIDYYKIYDVNYSGSLIFNDISINDIYSNSNIIKELNNIIINNNIDKSKYDIYFKRNKEWYNKFIFYKKKNI